MVFYFRASSDSFIQKEFFPCDIHHFSSLFLSDCAVHMYLCTCFAVCFSFVIFPDNLLLSTKCNSWIAVLKTILVSFVKICDKIS